MTAYVILKNTWTSILPLCVRRILWSATPSTIKKLKVRLLQQLSRNAEHDDIYDEDYYTQLVEPTMLRSCTVMARSIFNEYAPRSVIDVGCGTCALLAAFKEHDVDALGLEYAEAAIEMCKRRGVEVIKYDLRFLKL